MGKNKGCINENCVAYQKKTLFKDDDEFCPKCGQPLTYVCHKCHKYIPDDLSKLCPNCEAERKDKKDKMQNNGKKIVTLSVVVATTAIGVINTATDLCRDAVNAVQKAKKVVDDMHNVIKK